MKTVHLFDSFHSFLVCLSGLLLLSVCLQNGHQIIQEYSEDTQFSWQRMELAPTGAGSGSCVEFCMLVVSSMDSGRPIETY